jgi:hypothetical protein
MRPGEPRFRRRIRPAQFADICPQPASHISKTLDFIDRSRATVAAGRELAVSLFRLPVSPAAWCRNAGSLGTVQVCAGYMGTARAALTLGGRFPTRAARRTAGPSGYGSAARRGLRHNRALGEPINRFCRDVAIGVVRQWNRRSDTDDAAQ